MAQTEQTTVLIDVEVQASEALKRQQELKASLEALKKTQSETADKTSAEYIRQEAQIKNLNAQILANSKVIQANERDVQIQNGSLNDAQGAYRQLSDAYLFASQRAKDLAVAYGATNEKTIAAIAEAKRMSDRLKEVDSSVGQNQRSVGDYRGEIGKLFSAMGNSGGSFGAMANGLMSTSKGMMALNAANPLGWITMLISIIQTLVQKLKGSEEQTARLTQMMAPLKAVGDTITNMFSALISVLLDTAEAFIKTGAAIKEFFFGVDEGAKAAADSYTQYEKDKQAAVLETRKINEESAARELEISELKANIARKDLYTAEQRLMMNAEAVRLERKNADERKRIAIETLRLLEIEASRTENNAEMNEKLSQAKIAVINAEKAYNDNIRRLSSQTAALEAEIAADREAKLKARAEAAKKAAERRAADEKARIAKEAADAKKAADDAIKALDYELKMWKLKRDERNAGILLSEKEQVAARLELLDVESKAAQEKLRILLDKKQITQAEFDAQMLMLTQERETAISQIEGEERLKRMAAEKAAQEKNEAAKLEAIQQYEQAIADAQAALRKENAFAELDFQRQQLDLKYEAEIANAQKIGADTVAIEQAYAQTKQAIARAEASAKMDLAAGFAENLSEIFGKQTKVGKMAASAAIAIDTAKGAMAAFTSTQSIPVVGAALGIAAAGAVIAKGAKSIKDVWAVKSGLKGDGGGGGASVPSFGGGDAVASVTGALVARTNGQTQQAATTKAMSEAMQANPQQPVLLTSNLTDVLNNEVQIKSDNSL